MKKMIPLVLALMLASCSGIVPGPTPIPPIQEPLLVQEACTVAQWALPLIVPLLPQLPAQAQAAVAVVEAALPNCASGNATAAIVDAVNAIVSYLNAKGVRPPASLAVPVARLQAPRR